MQVAQEDLISSFLNPDLFEQDGDFSSPLSVSSPQMVSDFFSQATPPSDSPIEHPSSPTQSFHPSLPSLLPTSLPCLLPNSPPTSPKAAKQPHLPSSHLAPPPKLPLFSSCAQATQQQPLCPINPLIRLKEEPSAPNAKKRKTSSQVEPSYSHPVPVAPNPSASPLPTNAFSPGAPESELSKRQKQLIKNREAAFLSRQRRKRHMQELETKVLFLQKENDELKIKVEALEAKNQELSSRLQPGQRAGMKAAAMLVVFFSFAIFFNPISLSKSSVSLSEARIHTPLSLPGRSLQAIKEISQDLEPRLPSPPSSSLPEVSASDAEEPKPEALLEGKLYYNETSFQLPFDDDLEESHTIVETIDLEYWINQSLGTPIQNLGAVSLSERTLHPPHSKPDVAYVFCSDIFQFLPNEKRSGKPKLSLLVPSWDGSGAPGEPDHIMQIDCEVTGTQILPLPKKAPSRILEGERNATYLH